MKRRKNSFIIVLLGIVVGAGLYTSIQNAQQAQACGSAQGEIVSGPTISAQTVHSAFMNQSGTAAELQSMSTANYIVNQSSQYQIDDAFAMADWRQEDSYGDINILDSIAPKTLNIGNITINVDEGASRKIIKYGVFGDPIYEIVATDNVGRQYAGSPIGVMPNKDRSLWFPVYNTWQEGIHGWFVRVKSYVDTPPHTTDYLSFALYYVGGLWPTPQNLQNPPANIVDYVYGKQDSTGTRKGGLVNDVAALRQQNGGGSASGSTSSLQIPDGAWATPAARRDGQKLGLFNCTDTHSMVGAAMNLALHLKFRPCLHYGPDGNCDKCPTGWCGLFNVWDSTTPQPPAESLGGVVQCVSFVDSGYHMATGKRVPVAPNAGTWWQDYYLNGSEPGFKGIPVASGPPQPGDFIVYWDWDASTQSYQPPQIIGYDSQGNPIWKDFGHIAMIVGVQHPQAGQDGFIIIAQGNADHVLAEQSLSVSGSVWSVGKYDLGQQAQGYIRVTSH